MVKISQTGDLKLKFENIPKKTFSGLCQKCSQNMYEVDFFFANFQILRALRVSGMGCYISKCEKTKIIAPLCPTLF